MSLFLQRKKWECSYEQLMRAYNDVRRTIFRYRHLPGKRVPCFHSTQVKWVNFNAFWKKRQFENFMKITRQTSFEGWLQYYSQFIDLAWPATLSATNKSSTECLFVSSFLLKHCATETVIFSLKSFVQCPYSPITNRPTLTSSGSDEPHWYSFRLTFYLPFSMQKQVTCGFQI